MAGNYNTATTFSWKYQIPITDQNIQSAVNLWVSDVGTSIEYYGNIINWDTSNVTNMKGLFKNKTHFNIDITAWNTRNVTNMSEMFMGATSFNQDIKTNGAKWDVSKVTDMRHIFNGASKFTYDIENWDVSSLGDNITGFSSKFGGKSIIYYSHKSIKKSLEFKL